MHQYHICLRRIGNIPRINIIVNFIWYLSWSYFYIPAGNTCSVMPCRSYCIHHFLLNRFEAAAYINDDTPYFIYILLIIHLSALVEINAVNRSLLQYMTLMSKLESWKMLFFNNTYLDFPIIFYLEFTWIKAVSHISICSVLRNWRLVLYPHHV